MQLFIMNEYELQLIDWLMYIPAFISGIWACKKYDLDKKLLLLPLLLFVFKTIFEFSLIFIVEKTFKNIAVYLVIYQIITYFSLYAVYCLGFWFYKTKKIFVKILLPVVVILLALSLLKFVRMEITQKFGQGFTNGTFTGEVSKPAKLSELEFYTDSTLQGKVNTNDLNKKIYVLDFSNPNCGNCFRQMPKFQKIMERYSDNSEIGFYTIYVYNDTTDIAWFEKYTKKRNINIPHLFIDRKDEKYVQVFNYQLFPQYNIVKNDTIIFDGYLEILNYFDKKYLK